MSHEQQSWADGRMVAFDVETTGVDWESDRIVTAAVSVIPARGAGEPVHREWLLDPGVEIPEGAAEVHGITTEHAREHGQDAAAAIAEILGVLEEQLAAGAVLVAFNARFDLTMLDREARRHGLAPLSVPFHVVDPFVIDKHVDRYRRGKRTLGVLCELYEVSLGDDAHAADADALAAARLAWRIARRRPEIGAMPIEQLHACQVEWAATQAASLEEYFRRQGKDETCERAWPWVPFVEAEEVAA
jgi:DNA polymerase-3 subunit epsilon